MAVATGEDELEDLDLPEGEFTYVAGAKDRPWSHFTGRWQTMKPVLARMLRSVSNDQPVRILDVGACNGFFSLQAAYQHLRADVVAVEGSVGIGNGTAGMAGDVRNIIATEAVQTHLRWIELLAMQNCFIAPEVWDYLRVLELSGKGRPICDVMFLLSVIHHIDSISVKQYESAGLSRLDGLLDLIGRLLRLAPRHFIELPNRPWLAAAYDAYGDARSILEAAAKTTGLEWSFSGPIFSVDWYGQRDLWVLEVVTPVPRVDVRTCPFPVLYPSESEDGLHGPRAVDGDDVPGAADRLFDTEVAAMMKRALTPANLKLPDPLAAARAPVDLSDLEGRGLVSDLYLDRLAAQPCEPVEDWVAEAVLQAPRELLLAHLDLREAVREAEELLLELTAPQRPGSRTQSKGLPAAAGIAAPARPVPRQRQRQA